MDLYDSIVVGGGPAGLNGALYLGRSCRRVALIDSGDARNMVSGVMHNLVTNDGVTIDEFRTKARADIALYDVTAYDDEVVAVRLGDGHLVVATKASGELRARTVLYAAGMRSVMPAVEGMSELWGKVVFECPYCHAWEMRGRSFGVYGGEVPGDCLAALLTAWSPSITYLSDGRELQEEERAALKAAEIAIVADRVLRVCEDPEGVRVSLEGRPSLEFGAIFMHTAVEPRVGPLRPWLEAPDLSAIQTDERGRTALPRLYVAGDLGKNMTQAVAAAASGALAAMAINSDLVREDRPGSL